MIKLTRDERIIYGQLQTLKDIWEKLGFVVCLPNSYYDFQIMRTFTIHNKNNRCTFSISKLGLLRTSVKGVFSNFPQFDNIVEFINYSRKIRV